jgi:hypothetical protein
MLTEHSKGKTFVQNKMNLSLKIIYTEIYNYNHLKKHSILNQKLSFLSF